MNKRIKAIMATSLLFVNFMPLTNVLASETTEPDYGETYCIEESEVHHPKKKCDDETNIKIIKKNIKCLSDCEKKEFEEICKCYSKEKKLTNEQKCKILKLREVVIKAKLGDDYEEFVKLSKQEKLSCDDEKKLESFIKKIMK